jgi:hypothetical protein
LCGCRERSVSKYERLDVRDRRKGVKCVKVKVKVKVNGDVRIQLDERTDSKHERGGNSIR